ncbi:MAG: hypothetical protein IPF54_11545 [Draconibacterium sp.]|nr:hypothetical protein [Draconibacterium sp.]
MFGSGLSDLWKVLAAEIVQKINTCQNTVISIDIPSGLMGEDNSRKYCWKHYSSRFHTHISIPENQLFVCRK